MSSKRYFEEVTKQWDQMPRPFFSEPVREKAISVVQMERGRLSADSRVGRGSIARVSIFVACGEK